MAVHDLTDQIRQEKVAERYPPLFKRLPDRLFAPLASANRFQYWSLLCVLHAKRFGPEAPLPPSTGFLMREITADIAEELQYQDWAPEGDDVTPATPLAIRAIMVFNRLRDAGWIRVDRVSLVPKEEPSLELIQRMADLFGTSFPAAASRFACLSDMPCAFVTMERGAVRYAARSTCLRQAGAWISPKSIIPVGSVAHRLRSSGISATDTDELSQDIWFDNWSNGLDLWELSRHYARTDTTTSLLWFDSEDLPEAEVNRFGARVEDDGGLAELTGELPWPGRSRRR